MKYFAVYGHGILATITFIVTLDQNCNIRSHYIKKNIESLNRKSTTMMFFKNKTKQNKTKQNKKKRNKTYYREQKRPFDIL